VLKVLDGAMAAGGVGNGLFAVLWETALAQRIPPHLLSRVSAWDRMGSLALLPIGYLLTGAVADRLGMQEVMVGGGLIGYLVMALALLPRSTRELERWEDPPRPEGVVLAATAAP
jgi:MFS family permease